jgi:phosphomannomutase
MCFPLFSIYKGTAGFRYNANLPLDSLFLRMGIFACLRSWKCNFKAVGIMITASHNPECDNGLKIVDPSGDMLQESWEKYAEQFVNCSTVQECLNVLRFICDSENLSYEPTLTQLSSIFLQKKESSGINSSLVSTQQSFKNDNNRIINTVSKSKIPKIIIGYDTRPHSIYLRDILIRGITAAGGYHIDMVHGRHMHVTY